MASRVGASVCHLGGVERLRSLGIRVRARWELEESCTRCVVQLRVRCGAYDDGRTWHCVDCPRFMRSQCDALTLALTLTLEATLALSLLSLSIFHALCSWGLSAHRVVGAVDPARSFMLAQIFHARAWGLFASRLSDGPQGSRRRVTWWRGRRRIGRICALHATVARSAAGVPVSAVSAR
jgi:hypothetical protein